MPTTSNRALRYPQGSDNANVALYFQNLATDVDTKLPGGELGYAVRTTQAGPVASGATGWVTTSGLSTTFTLTSQRRIKQTLDLQVTSDQAGTLVGAAIFNVTTNGRKGKTMLVGVANQANGLTIVTRTILAAGTYNIVGQQAWFGGPGGAYFTADPQELIIEDMGPA